jgi:hypothetical protein
MWQRPRSVKRSFNAECRFSSKFPSAAVPAKRAKAIMFGILAVVVTDDRDERRGVAREDLA